MPFDKSFEYRSVIGKLNYLEKATNITHQCARFSSDPKVEHVKALRWLGRYLYATRKKGTILRPVENKDLEVYVDADFSGNWESEGAAWDTDTARSRHGYLIMYAGCPILWKSQMQTEIALSTSESEYTGLSYALRSAIPIMEQLKEMKQHGFPIKTAVPKIHCRVFEDNSGALEMAKTHIFFLCLADVSFLRVPLGASVCIPLTRVSPSLGFSSLCPDLSRCVRGDTTVFN
eukprot:scaffold2708_cov54-Attheya_sp.AAC.1